MSQPKRYRPIIVRGEPKFVQDETGDFTTLSEYYLQRDKADRFEAMYHNLKKEVEHLKKAERLIIWDGQQWKVRLELNGNSL